MNLELNVGNRIKNIRNSKGLSTYDLEKLTNISQSTISKMENGKRSLDIKLLKEIAIALGIDLEELFKDEESELLKDSINNIQALALEGLKYKSNSEESKTLPNTLIDKIYKSNLTEHEQDDLINYINYLLSKRKE